MFRWIKDRPTLLVGVAGLMLGLSVSFVGSRFEGFTLVEAFRAFYANVGTELLSIALTILIIDALNERRQREEADSREEENKALQHALAQETQAQVRTLVQAQEIARLRATGSLREKQIILDGLKNTGLLRSAALRGMNLQGATHLSSADFTEADLRGCNLSEARLREALFNQADLSRALLCKANLSLAHAKEARLVHADLSGAVLDQANLSRAKLIEANFTGCSLHQALLRGADMREANLAEARLSQANLLGARNLLIEQLKQARTLKGARLPDGHLLPNDDAWKADFEAWCARVPVDEVGHVLS